MKHTLYLAAILLFSITSCKAGNSSDMNQGINSSKIIKNINKGKSIVIQDIIITDDLDFTQIEKSTIFSSSHRISEVDVPVTFLKCIFLGKVKTNRNEGDVSITTHFKSNITFEACDFRAEVDFSNAIIDGQVNFTGAIFRENATFNNLTIKGRETYFTSFSSEKAFNMQEASINGNIDFFKGKSKAKFSFQGTDFTGSARFSDMVCDGKVDFSLATFRSNVLYTYAKFGSDFRMSDARCEGICDLISVTFSADARICNSVFNNKLNFSNSELKGILDLSGTLFAVSEPNFENVNIVSPGKIIRTPLK